MSTLKELAYYCKEENPTGALLLTGEWGCGKTHIIEKELTEALKDSHIIVRISLFGVNSIDDLNKAIKNAWLGSCMPFVGRLHEDLDKLNDGKKALSVLTPMIKVINPLAGNVADAMIAVNFLDMIPITPEVEDHLSIPHKKKKVVLVFDDMERSLLDRVELLGTINEYCENKHFNTIIVANEMTVINTMQDSTIAYNVLKEKIISRTVFNDPDYNEILESVIGGRAWQTDAYAEFLYKNRDLIYEVFVTESETKPAGKEKIHKYHNIRCLISSLKDFFRIYYHLRKCKVPFIERYFYSFLAYSLVSKSGIEKDMAPCMEVTDDDIKTLYPFFTADTLLDHVRQWVTDGKWNKEALLAELAPRIPQKTEDRESGTGSDTDPDTELENPEDMDADPGIS